MFSSYCIALAIYRDGGISKKLGGNNILSLLENVKFKWKIVSNFVAFLENPNLYICSTPVYSLFVYNDKMGEGGTNFPPALLYACLLYSCFAICSLYYQEPNQSSQNQAC